MTETWCSVGEPFNRNEKFFEGEKKRMTELYIARTAPFCDQVPAARAMPLLDGERRERTARLRRPASRGPGVD